MKKEYVKIGMPQQVGKNLRSKKCIYFIAEKDNEIVGFTGAIIEKAEKYFTYSKRGYIFFLYVKKSYRNKKIGTKLLDKVLDWLKNKKIRYVKIDTYASNKGAIRLYHKKECKDYTLELYKEI